MTRSLRLSGDIALQELQARLRPHVVGEANANDQRPDAPALLASASESTITMAPGATKPARSKAIPPPLETEVVRAVLAALRTHPDVCFVWRQNSGGAYDATGRFLRFAFPGCPDILGMLRTGRFLAVECKRQGGGLTGEQHAFLMRVQRGGGLAFVARDAADVYKHLPLPGTMP